VRRGGRAAFHGAAGRHFLAEGEERWVGYLLAGACSTVANAAAVALVFGPSMMSPREAVIVDFDDEAELADVLRPASPQTDQEDASLEDSQTLTPPSPHMPREKLVRLCAQKLMREVFTHSMEHFSRYWLLRPAAGFIHQGVV
jgi:hypothetical protein